MLSIRCAPIVPLLLVLASCGTLLSQAGGPGGCGSNPATLPNVYSGVVLDVQGGLDYKCPVSGECEFFSPGASNNVELFLLLDIPLSLTLDTILLPYTAYKQLKHGNICTKGVPGPAVDRRRSEPVDSSRVVPTRVNGATNVVVEPRTRSR